MSAAMSWEVAAKTPSGAPPEVAALVGDDAAVLFAVPEHRVVMPPEGARDSRCDVFALMRDGAETVAVVVVTKAAEPFGRTLRDWLAEDDGGGSERLDFICGRLGLSRDALDGEVGYELLERAAAAVVEAERFKTDRAAMIVQSFSPENRWFKDFARFAAVLNLSIEIPGQAGIHALPCGKSLIIGWAGSDPSAIFRSGAASNSGRGPRPKSDYAKDGKIDPGMVAAILGATVGEISLAVGPHEGWLDDREHARSAEAQRGLGDLVDVIRRAAPWRGSETAAFAWFHSEPLVTFGGRTPMALTRSGLAHEVLEYIDAADAGLLDHAA